MTSATIKIVFTGVVAPFGLGGGSREPPPYPDRQDQSLGLRSEDVPCPVDHRHNVNLVWFDVVNNAVGAFYYFANSINIIFRNLAAREWEICDLLRSSGYAIHHTLGVLRRVQCNKSVYGI